MRFNPIGRRIYLASALGLVLVTAMSACSSSPSSTSSSTTPSTPTLVTSSAPATTPSAAASSTAPASGGSASAVAEITTNWEEFFNSSTPASKRVALLQNGSEFSSAISSLSANPIASGVASTVLSVKLTSATQAAVKYDITLSKAPVATNQSGTAVLQDGVWKVGDGAFCGLLQEAGPVLNITVPAACS